MASLRGKSDFIALVADEIACGIDCALRYWLGRIELEVIDRSLTPQQRLRAVEEILTEYKFHSADGDTMAPRIDSADLRPRQARAKG
jgi:hypothetical protein